MLSFERQGSRGPLLILLHWLGGEAQSWRAVNDVLAERGLQPVALDLPGFGHSASVGGFNKAAMADAVVTTIQSLRAAEPAGHRDWFLAGHSMGGAVAAIVARRALDGEAGLDGLRGLALVSPSPPGPEPMPDSKRREMLSSLGQSTGKAKEDRAHALTFLDDNTGRLALPEAVREGAVAGVLRMNRTAFRAWLEHGSREDWADRIGSLALPATVLAGSEDKALGPEAQREHTLPHFPAAELHVLEGAGHLAPMERPREVAELFTQFFAGCGVVLSATETQPGPLVSTLMHSERTSPLTLKTMEERLGGATDWNYAASVFSAEEMRTARALAAAVIPDAGFDLAAALDRELAAGVGDGWRFAVLPGDASAWHKGFASLNSAAQRLHKVGFIALHADQQHDLLTTAAAGDLGQGALGRLHLGTGAEAYTAEQMKSWFEDVRGEFVRLYVADPRTMDRIGFTGFADDLGFTDIQLEQQEEFRR